MPTNIKSNSISALALILFRVDFCLLFYLVCLIHLIPYSVSIQPQQGSTGERLQSQVIQVKDNAHRCRNDNQCGTAQKMKFSLRDFFSRCDQIRNFLRIWSHLLMKPLMENFIFCIVGCLR